MEQADPGPLLAPLDGDTRADVVIAGGGYTGLWTAYYLKTLAPALEVCVLEAQRCGFGASGRNGGWMMAALEGETRLLAALDGERRGRVRALIHSILPEVESVLAQQGIDCDYHRGGGIYAAARYPEQLALQRALLDDYRAAGFGDSDVHWLSAAELGARLRIADPLGGIYIPHIARIQPARLVLGLVQCLRQLGVRIYEQSPVIGLAPGRMVTARGAVKAPTRLLALEGYSASLPAVRGRVLAIQSRIVATEPLDDALWDDLGLAGREVFCDASPLITYGQRSADNRMVFGARGSYRFGGAPQSEFGGREQEFGEVRRLLQACFPQLAAVPVSHCWGGTLGVPRSGIAHAVYDPVTGLGTAGGYFGEGVGAANLMARTLADQVLGRDTELAQAPWAFSGVIERKLRRWEPEPLRWLGYRAIDTIRRLEERLYQRQAPGWQRRPVQGASRWLDRRMT
ncbi:FAD-dependent oxidoreductase [Seongchinamella sediminis]|uniref:FAD-dependent oxidoreductase n=2 Tax=Seongchinamella sediminis TaxID=2283635 RepID=A0A3L7DUU8_9GAMM|nr:FAD-dependent oxidoreductase [Seongchinamella sediminis]